MSQLESTSYSKTPGKPAPWNDPRIRSLFFQILVILAVVAFATILVTNTLENMERIGIKTGFDFLVAPAGFDVVMSIIPYEPSDTYLRVFFVGILNTLLVAVIGVFIATALGFVIGVARLSNNWIVAKLAAIYVDTFRNIPLLLQIYFWYFAVLKTLPSPKQSLSLADWFFLNVRGIYIPEPQPEALFTAVVIVFVMGIVASWAIGRWARERQAVTGKQFPVSFARVGVLIALPISIFLILGMPMNFEYPVLQGFNFRGGIRIIPELAALVLALAIYTAAFIAEIVRAGIMSVSHGQTEASRALGLKERDTLQLIIIPQAMRVIIPPLTSQYLNLTKNSSLAMAIGYSDLVAVFMGTSLNQSGRAVEIVAMTMAIYLAISLLTSTGMNTYNRTVALKER
jgi:general L-amino acid transport system permease protein